MKKNIFFLSLFVLFQNLTFSQCEYKYSELISLIYVNDSNFETEVLKKGFEYDSEGKLYVCLLEEDKPNMVFRSIENKILTLGYYTYSKTTYISIKEDVIKAGFKYAESDDKDGMISHIYEAKGMIIVFASQKDSSNNTSYLISIQLSK